MELPGFSVMKDGNPNFLQYNEKISELVTRASSHRTDQNQEMFDRFQATLEKVITAPEGSHGSHLIKKAKKQLGTPPNGTDIKIKDLGANPTPGIDGPPRWETADWEATAEEVKAKGQRHRQLSAAHQRFSDRLVPVQGIPHYSNLYIHAGSDSDSLL